MFCGKIPKDVFEDELIPLFEKCGVIWDLRLMMDPITGLNRGYAFVTFTDKSSAQEAVKQVRVLPLPCIFLLSAVLGLLFFRYQMVSFLIKPKIIFSWIQYLLTCISLSIFVFI